MPKVRQTCTRCSMRRQKCDRKTPCTRCVQNKEEQSCTIHWPEGYDPSVHRKYPKKRSTTSPEQTSEKPEPSLLVDSQAWPIYTPPIRTGSAVVRSNRAPSVNRNNKLVTSERPDTEEWRINSPIGNGDPSGRTQTMFDRSIMQRTGDGSNHLSPATMAVEVIHLQTLIPSRNLVLQMVDYHYRFMTYWLGGIYHGPQLKAELLQAYGDSDQLDLRSQDWLWSALIFSILSASLFAAPDSICASWGYPGVDRLKLAQQWMHATISCLHLGALASKPHVRSIQAIIVLHTPEHLSGSAKEWAVYQAAAVVSARTLGLHKLAAHPEDRIEAHNMTTTQREAFLQREIGRKIWSTLSSHDWLCSSSHGMYSIQKKHCTSILPQVVDDETLARVSVDNHPTYTALSNHLIDIASILRQFLDDSIDAPELAAKYVVVLRYDAMMRDLIKEKVPRFLSVQVPFNPTWPRWVAWARQSFQAARAHKLIMIHQAFLSRSFKDVRYTYSRWACLSAAKDIIFAMEVPLFDKPQWWIEHAFVVTAGLCLSLDIFQRTQEDPERLQHVDYVQRAITILRDWPYSAVAVHGIRVLESMLAEHARKFNTRNRQPVAAQEVQGSAAEVSTPRFPENMSVRTIVDSVSEETYTPDPVTPEEPLSFGPLTGTEIDIDATGFEDWLEGLPVDLSVDNYAIFESMQSMGGL